MVKIPTSEEVLNEFIYQGEINASDIGGSIYHIIKYKEAPDLEEFINTYPPCYVKRIFAINTKDGEIFLLIYRSSWKHIKDDAIIRAVKVVGFPYVE